MAQTNQHTRRGIWQKIMWLSTGIILSAGIVIAGVWGWGRVQTPKPNLNTVTAVEEKVSQLYALPSDETPALATVTDSKKLSSSFAGKVQNGDKLLIYQKNGKAIVYRPSLNKIVDVEPVTIDTLPGQ